MRLVVVLMLLSLGVHAQEEPPEVLITYNKFVYLMFPSEVEKFDLGVGSVFADYDGKILKLIPQAPEVPETSLFVTTETGHYYFIINLQEDGELERYVYRIDQDVPMFESSDTRTGEKGLEVKDGKGEQGSKAKGVGDTALNNNTSPDNQVTENMHKVYDMEKKRIEIGKIGSGMGAYVGVIAYDRKYLYLTVLVSNEATIDYKVDFIKFFIESKARAKKGISYEEELLPVGELVRDTAIPQGNTGKYVYAFEAFTMDRDKQLRVEIRERDGDRNVILYVKGKDVLGAEMVE